jgi:hypothetical protein
VFLCVFWYTPVTYLSVSHLSTIHLPYLSPCLSSINHPHSILSVICLSISSMRIFISISQLSITYRSIFLEYYSATKKNEIMPFAEKWMELESIMLGEITQVF